jgi:hypothetical protein
VDRGSLRAQGDIHGRDHVQYVELCGTRRHHHRSEWSTPAWARTPRPRDGFRPSCTASSGPLHDCECGRHHLRRLHQHHPAERILGAADAPARRLVDMYSRKIKMDPWKSGGKTSSKPTSSRATAAGLSYDSGNYQGASTRRSEDRLSAFRPEQARARKEAATWASASPRTARSAASQVAGAVWIRRRTLRQCHRAGLPTGVVRCTSAASRPGRGDHLRAGRGRRLAIPIGEHRDRLGRRTTPQGWGTTGRTTACGAVTLATRKCAKARLIAAHLLGPRRPTWNGRGKFR